ARAIDRLRLALGRAISSPTTGVGALTTNAIGGLATNVEQSNLEDTQRQVVERRLQAQGYVVGPGSRVLGRTENGQYTNLFEGDENPLQVLGARLGVYTPPENEAQRVEREAREQVQQSVQQRTGQILQEAGYQVNQEGTPTAINLPGGGRQVLTRDQQGQAVRAA